MNEIKKNSGNKWNNSWMLDGIMVFVALLLGRKMLLFIFEINHLAIKRLANGVKHHSETEIL